MHFPSTGLGHKGTAELKAPKLVTIYNGYPQEAGSQSADGVWQHPGSRQRSGRHLKSNSGESWQHTPGSQQGSPSADIKRRSELQELLALWVLAANKHGYGKRYAFLFSPLYERHSGGHLRSWE